MDDARACGHPLHVAFVNDAASAAGVAVCHFAVVGDGNGFKAFVRVLADTARAAGFVGENS